MNRHTCDDGFHIKTTLLKGITWDFNDPRSPDGSAKFGAGVVFSEAIKEASERGLYLATGWAATVGVVGWALGGGHGPFASQLGLGVDNTLEVEIILANGTLVTANDQQNTDLYWALRGGGGSAWGIITSITYRAFKSPQGGFTM